MVYIGKPDAPLSPTPLPSYDTPLCRLRRPSLRCLLLGTKAGRPPNRLIFKGQFASYAATSAGAQGLIALLEVQIDGQPLSVDLRAVDRLDHVAVRVLTTYLRKLVATSSEVTLLISPNPDARRDWGGSVVSSLPHFGLNGSPKDVKHKRYRAFRIQTSRPLSSQETTS